jgi:hypothetical protein
MVECDFGLTLPGKEPRRRVKIENPTDAPLHVAHVYSGCSCAAGKLLAKTIAPGESTWLEVTFRAPHRDGPASGNVMVDFRETNSPVYQVTVKGHVRSLLVAEPLSLEFDFAPPDTPLSRTVRLHNRGDRDVAVTVEPPDWLQAEVRPPAAASGQNRQTWELVVRTKPDKPPQAARAATLVVRSDSEKVGSAFVGVRQKPALEAAPSHLAFGTVAPGKTREMKVSLRTAPALGELTDKDLDVKHTLGDELDVQVLREKAAYQFTLLVRFQPKQSQGLVDGELVIATRKGTAPPVRVAVSGAAPLPR